MNDYKANLAKNEVEKINLENLNVQWERSQEYKNGFRLMSELGEKLGAIWEYKKMWISKNSSVNGTRGEAIAAEIVGVKENIKVQLEELNFSAMTFNRKKGLFRSNERVQVIALELKIFEEVASRSLSKELKKIFKNYSSYRSGKRRGFIETENNKIFIEDVEIGFKYTEGCIYAEMGKIHLPVKIINQEGVALYEDRIKLDNLSDMEIKAVATKLFDTCMSL